MAHDHDAKGWIVPQQPGGVRHRHNDRFARARRQGDDQTGRLSTLDPLQLMDDRLVVPVWNEGPSRCRCKGVKALPREVVELAAKECIKNGYLAHWRVPLSVVTGLDIAGWVGNAPDAACSASRARRS